MIRGRLRQHESRSRSELRPRTRGRRGAEDRTWSPRRQPGGSGVPALRGEAERRRGLQGKLAGWSHV